jgi:hypothetical protein
MVWIITNKTPEKKADVRALKALGLPDNLQNIMCLRTWWQRKHKIVELLSYNGKLENS